MMSRNQFFLSVIALLSSVALAGCLSSSDSDSSGGETGTLSLAITDAPVDRAEAVWIEFDSITLKHADGERLTFEYDEPRKIDLLALQGEDYEPLLTDEEVPAGRYEWVRLGVLPYDGAQTPGNKLTSSYIQFPPDTEFESTEVYLEIPSGLQTGLKMQGGFVVPVNDRASYTIDFDLRRSIVTVPRGGNHEYPDYMLKPVVRMIDNAEVGHLRGVVDFTLLPDVDACPDTGAVYVYEGADAELTDMQEDVGPVATALLRDREDGTYGYRVGFLTAGDYTVALTCDADLDQPDEDNSEDVDFVWAASIEIVAGEKTQRDIPGLED